MKRFKNRVVLIAVALVAVCSQAMAQEEDWSGTNRDDFGNIVRGSYMTNEWYDNWYIVATGGVSTAVSKVNDPRIFPQFEFGLMKWFTPSIAARVGYQGFVGKEYLTAGYNPYQINHSPLPFDGNLGGNGLLHYGLGYIHGDFLWSLTNALGGYKQKRFFNSAIYASTGLVRLYDNNKGEGFGSENHENEWGLGIGLYNTFRINNRLALTLDLRHFSTPSRYVTLDGITTNRFSAFFGLAYNIYRTYWNRSRYLESESDAAKADADAARQALKDLSAQNEELSRRIAEKEAEIAARAKELEAAGNKYNQEPVRIVLDESDRVIEVPYNVLVERVKEADHVVYFYINEDKANFSEMRHLDEYIRKTLKEDPDHVFYLTGSADKGTGSYERNTYLCRSRAYGVHDILVNDYRVDPRNVIIKATIVSEKHVDGALDRCVIIESR